MSRKPARGKLRFRPTFERLEDRCLFAVSSWVFPGTGDQLVYTPDGQADHILDYSNVGYQGGIVPIPSVPVQTVVNPGPGDDTALIQAAIDQVSALPLDANGFRGAVLLTAGEYQINDHLEIRASGVVLRGEGDSETGTVLRATGTDQRTLVQVSGTGAQSRVPGTEHNLVETYVPVGTRTFQVDSTAGLRVGDTVVVRRFGNAAWLSAISMDQLGAGSWQPGLRDLEFDRVITRIEGDWVTVDAPLANAVEQQYGGGSISRYVWPGRIENVGIEQLRGITDFTSPTDEDHSWSFISLAAVQNAWVRDATAEHFAFATVEVGKTAKWVTVQQCRSLAPISQIIGDRRYPFHVNGELTLVRDCYSEEGRHDFANSQLVAGPNVFVDSQAVNAYDGSGPHLHWSVGTLFDNLNIQPAASGGGSGHRGTLDIENRGNLGGGGNHGWAGANMTIWNTTVPAGYRVQNPPTAQNWMIGATGPLLPVGPYSVGPTLPGIIESQGTPVLPRSLYYAQLQERLAFPALDFREYRLGDIDNLGAGQPADAVPVDPAWRSQIAGQTTLPLHGFDDASPDHWVPFTLNFSLAPNEQVVGATLSLGLRAVTGDGSTDRIFLDSLGLSFPLGDLNGAPLSSTATDGRVLDLASHLSLLQDGRLNVALASGVAVDWAVLHLQVAPQVGTGQRPAISDVADQAVNEDNGTAAIPFIVGDAETPAGSLIVTASSSNPALVPDANIVLGGSGANRTVMVTPAPNQSGTVSITLSVRDDSGWTVTDVFDLRVIGVNDTPAVSGGTTSTAQGVPVLVDLWQLVSDVETPDEQLRFTVGDALNGTVALLADGHTARFTPAAGYTGPAHFTYTVTDVGYGPSTVLHYSFEPPDTTTDGLALDSAPMGRDGLLQQFAGGSAAIVSDAPAALAPYSSRSLQLVEIDNSNSARLTRRINPDELDFNNHDWTFAGWFQRGDLDNEDMLFHLGDGDGFGGEDELYIFAQPGQANIAVQHWFGASQDVGISRGNINPGEWHHAALVFRAAGAGGQGALEFYVDGTLVASDSTFTLNMTPALPVVFGGHGQSVRNAQRFFNGKLDDLILYSAALGAGDIAQLTTSPAGFREGTITAPATVNVIVTPGNNPPSISDTPDRTTLEDTSTSAIAFTVGDVETPAELLLVTVGSSNPALVPDSNIILNGSGASRTLTITPLADQFGTTTITITVRDTDGATTSKSFVLTVLPVNDAPSAASASGSTVESSPVDVDLWPLVSDIETPDEQLLFNVSSAVNGTVVLLADGHTARFTPAAGYTGPASFTYTVTDVAYGADAILHYGFEEPDTTTDSLATDNSGQRRDGTLQQIGAGTFAFVPGGAAALAPFSHQSLRLTESPNNAARLTRVISPAELDFSNHDWTFAGWFNRNDADNEDVILHLGAGDGFGPENELYVWASGPSSIGLFHWTSSSDVSISRSGVNPGEWHHVAVVFTAAGGGTGTLALYVDGTLVGSDSSFTLAMDQTFPVVFGGHTSTSTLTQRWFDGRLDDLALFGSALGAVDVGRLTAGNVGHLRGLTVGPAFVQVMVNPVPLRVTSLAPTSTGFTATFNAPIDPAVLNLYDGPAGTLGAADINLAPALPGSASVAGSLVIDSTRTQIQFIKTGGPLAPGSYVFTLRSAADGFKALSGGLLDGDGDGTPGDNHTGTFMVSPPPGAVVVGIADFARGPDQLVRVPATNTGLPLTLSNSTGVTAVTLNLRYNPALLAITGIVALPAGSSATLDTTTPGVAAIAFTSPIPLPAGVTEFVRLTATVPRSAANLYKAKQVLNLDNLTILAGTVSVPATDDDGLQLVVYFGDASANGTLGAGDAVRALQASVGLGNGFAALPLTDPSVVADITGNGRLNATDATRILQEAVGIDRPEIPDLPDDPPVPLTGGIDPLLNIPKNLRARPGRTVTVPVNLDFSEGLQSVDLALSFDAERLEVVSVRRGSLTRDFDLFAVNVDQEAGTIRVGLGRTAGPSTGRGSGSVLQIRFRVRAEASAGTAVINLRKGLGATRTQLNEGGLDLNPDPSDQAGDMLDGLITVRGQWRGKRPVVQSSDK